MKYIPHLPELFTKNRKKLVKRLAKNSVVIIHANDIMPTNADGTLPFYQNSNLFYLTGVDQEETIFVMAPDFPDKRLKEMLFLRETSEEIAIWEGHKLTKTEGQSCSGITEVRWNDGFEKVLQTIMAESETVYLYRNEHIRNANRVQTANDRFIQRCKDQYPLHKYERLAPIIYDLRSVKENEEIELLSEACRITEEGFRKILRFVEPGKWEYEVEAEYLHTFINRKSRGFAYTPIIAGGTNACVLHYIENNQQLHDGDLLLMDVGAEYGSYNADMTRTIPINGKFTQRQKDVYNAVLRVKNYATSLLTPGNRIPDYHKAVGEEMEKELVDLGLLSSEEIRDAPEEWPAYKKYFMHGTSHHLGLDVHDVASVYTDFKPGMVFTVEPGIYIPDENIGIRLEDNIVITEKGQDNLMASIPIEVDEIEELMNE